MNRFLALFLVASSALAQQRPAYQSLRYDEDWSFLRDPSRRTDPFDPLKFIALDERGDRYLTLGGEARIRFEHYGNANWGSLRYSDGYLLQRYMFHTDAHFGDRLRFFGQLKSGLEGGRVGGPRPIDEDRLDLHQLFADVRFGRLTVRAGRQELELGSTKLISAREIFNVRQSFDGVRLFLPSGNQGFGAFAVRPVKTLPGVFDDGADLDQFLYSPFAYRLPSGNRPGGVIYLGGLQRRVARYDGLAGSEYRHTLGARIYGRRHPFDYSIESIGQWGHVAQHCIRAGAFAVDGWWNAPSGTRVGLKADITTGDRNRNDRKEETFFPLFTGTAYSGRIAMIGPSNSIAFSPMMEIPLRGGVTLRPDVAFFWRESVHDGIYNSLGIVLRSGARSRARFIGTQSTLQVDDRLDAHTLLSITYTHFAAGEFLKETPPGKNTDFFTSFVTYRF